MSDLSFFEVASKINALKFGSYKLKSGRISPYYFNLGLFNNGENLYKLASFYAHDIIKNNLEFDVLFGPAYKGIILSTVVCSFLFKTYGKKISFCFNRKEIKKYGESDLLVGADIRDKKILIIDDVIAAGVAINESIDILRSYNAKIIGAIVALDRQEKADNSKLSAIQTIENAYKFPVFAIATLHELIKFIMSQCSIDNSILDRMKLYQKEYGI
jgi:orotate phosphoribosyltransferase